MITTHGDKDPNPRNKNNLTPKTARVGVQIGKVTSGVLQNGFIATYKITNAYFEKLKKYVNYDISSQKDQCENEIIGTETTKFWNIRSYN